MRMWEIRENPEDYRHELKREHYGHEVHSGVRSYRDDVFEEGYECGYEEGYRKAMKEAHSYYGERRMK